MGDVILIGGWGQSNEQGTPPGKGNVWNGYQPAPSNRYPGRALEWEDGFTPTLMDLADGRSPLAGWGTSEPYKALPGSLHPSFFNTFLRYLPETTKTVLVRCAIGGTSVLAENTNGQSGKGDWSPTATGNQARFTKAIERMLAAKADIEAAGDTVTAMHIIWHGGERDALEGNGLTDGTFQEQFGNLAARARTALSWPTLNVYVARVGHPDYVAAPEYEQYEPNLQRVRDAQDRACADPDVPGMVMAYTDCVHFADWGLMSESDHIHYSQPGYNLMGEGLAYAVAADLGLAEVVPEPPEFLTSNTGRRLSTADAVPNNPDYITPGNHTFIVPDGVTSIDVEAEGAGGGGGGGSALQRGAGGGGGAYAATFGIAVVPGTSYPVTVGAGGNWGQTNISQNATAGGDSSFGSLVIAKGGTGGGNGSAAAGTGGQASASTGTVKTSGQNGVNSSGGVGQRGKGGDGAAPLGGAGGAGEVANGVHGNPGAVAGGAGGGGGITGGAIHGGLGASGRVKITLHFD